MSNPFEHNTVNEEKWTKIALSYDDMFKAFGVNHIGSHLVKIFYPLKVHTGEKTK